MRLPYKITIFISVLFIKLYVSTCHSMMSEDDACSESMLEDMECDKIIAEPMEVESILTQKEKEQILQRIILKRFPGTSKADCEGLSDILVNRYDFFSFCNPSHVSEHELCDFMYYYAERYYKYNFMAIKSRESMNEIDFRMCLTCYDYEMFKLIEEYRKSHLSCTMDSDIYCYRGGRAFEIERKRNFLLQKKTNHACFGGEKYGTGIYITRKYATAKDYAERKCTRPNITGFFHHCRHYHIWAHNGMVILRIKIKPNALLVGFRKSSYFMRFLEEAVFISDTLDEKRKRVLQSPFDEHSKAAAVCSSIFTFSNDPDDCVDSLEKEQDFEVGLIKDPDVIEKMYAYDLSMSYKLHIPYTCQEIIENGLIQKQLAVTEHDDLLAHRYIFDENTEHYILMDVFVTTAPQCSEYKFFIINSSGEYIRVRPPLVETCGKNYKLIRNFHIQYDLPKCKKRK